MALQTWIIEPRDSLIVRDGKPFGANITQASSLDFPFPSTTTGGVRTRSGLNAVGVFDTDNINLKHIEDIKVRGSLLAEINLHRNSIEQIYFPKPADALLMKNDEYKESEIDIIPLKPINFLDCLANTENLLVGTNQIKLKGKPSNKFHFWNWIFIEEWLKETNIFTKLDGNNYFLEKLEKDSRTHVAINDNLTSNDGNLFQTSGLEFNYKAEELSRTKKLSLIVFVEDDENGLTSNIKEGLAPLGGERRLVSWRKIEPQSQITKCPDEIKKQIIKDGKCRLMFATPAYFKDGLPKDTDKYEIKAVACDRYQTVSGWDFKDNLPKPTRRLLPAGSVLFLELKGDQERIGSWIDNTWFNCISDDSQTVKDGFGLCLLGTWSEEPLDEWR